MYILTTRDIYFVFWALLWTFLGFFRSFWSFFFFFFETMNLIYIAMLFFKAFF